MKCRYQCFVYSVRKQTLQIRHCQAKIGSTRTCPGDVLTTGIPFPAGIKIANANWRMAGGRNRVHPRFPPGTLEPMTLLLKNTEVEPSSNLAEFHKPSRFTGSRNDTQKSKSTRLNPYCAGFTNDSNGPLVPDFPDTPFPDSHGLEMRKKPVKSKTRLTPDQSVFRMSEE